MKKLCQLQIFTLKRNLYAYKGRTGENGIFTIDQRKEMEEISVLLAIS
jgi:hypothetical protein